MTFRLILVKCSLPDSQCLEAGAWVLCESMGICRLQKQMTQVSKAWWTSQFPAKMQHTERNNGMHHSGQYSEAAMHKPGYCKASKAELVLHACEGAMCAARVQGTPVHDPHVHVDISRIMLSSVMGCRAVA